MLAAHPNGVSFVTLETVMGHIRDSLQRNKELIPETMVEYDWTDVLQSYVRILATGGFALEAACGIGVATYTWGNDAPAAIGRLDCGDPEENGGFSYWTVFPVE